MFKLFRAEDPQLTAALDTAYSHLSTLQPDEEGYATTLKQITDLNALKNQGLDPNKLIVVAGNLAVGFAVLKYEDRGIVTSKIWSFMQKL